MCHRAGNGGGPAQDPTRVPPWDPPTPTHSCHLPEATQESPGEGVQMTTRVSPSQTPQESLTLAASVVIQQDVARRAGAEVRARLVHTLMLAEELGEAALVHIWG